MTWSLSETRLLLRSFLIQGSWNYRTLVGTGVAWALRPAEAPHPHPPADGADPRTGEGEEVSIAVEPFNTHPYLSTIALGALTRVHQDGIEPARARAFRQALRSPLGGLGDALVWGAWRPACLLGAAGIALAGAPPIVVVMAFLWVYNALHLALRVRGIQIGLEFGLDVAGGIRSMGLPAWTERIRAAGVLLLGLALGLLLIRGATHPELGFVWIAGALALFLAGFFGGDVLRRWGSVLLLLLILMGWWAAP